MAEAPQKPTRPHPKGLFSAPFFWAEWCCEWMAYGLGRLAVFKLLEYAAKLTIVVAVVAWIAEAPHRKRSALRDAWRVVIAAQGQRGSGGRIQALEYLNRGGESLGGLDAAGAHLAGVKLPGANLRGANLSGADLSGADLTEADLSRAELHGIGLSEAHLSGADFSRSGLTGADFARADLSGADLSRTDLQTASLSGADLVRAKLRFARLVGVDFSDADLSGADLYGARPTRANLTRADLSGTDLTGADFREVRNVTPEQIMKARDWDKAVYDDDLREKLGLPPDYLEKIEWAPEMRKRLMERHLLPESEDD